MPTPERQTTEPYPRPSVMAEEDSPLIKALPPESDYLTYLTIVEYNLSQENLPILHKVLQDEILTTNIGWDLVHLLVPYLPDSEQCLQDIARLGNPREVILKVTESLRLIEYDQAQASDEDESSANAGAADSGDVRTRADSSTYPMRTASTAGAEQRPGSSQAVELPPPLPLPNNQFIVLLSMLSILHTRIKTKHPSRFLSTTLQAILASFSNCMTHREEMVLAIVKTISAVSGTKRPSLPARKSSGMLWSYPKSTSDAPAGDPEAPATMDATPEESALQRKLLQSFVTHVLEEYLLNLESGSEDIPGMAWCSRLMEKLHPERVVPKTKTLADRFANEERLNRRIDAIGQLVTIAQDLKLTDEELLSAAITVEKVPSALVNEDEDEPPESADDIPLSRLGSLMLYTARQVSNILYNSKARDTPPFAIFPDHQELFKHCMSAHEQGTGQLGTEPEGLIDAILALGIVALDRNNIGEPASDDQFTEYLQVTALLSSNCPSPNLRGHAHYLTSTILRSQPDEKVRLAFIRDTLEHCPFENLKVSAVGWIKGETIEANPPTALSPTSPTVAQGEEPHSIFATPLALDILSPFLFPSLHADLITAPIQDAYLTFRTNLSFYLASLNFLYLLLTAKHLHDTLGIKDLWGNNDVAGSFLQPLRDAGARFRVAMGVSEVGKEDEKGGGELEEERSAGSLAELNVLDEGVERVTGAVKFLNE